MKMFKGEKQMGKNSNVVHYKTKKEKRHKTWLQIKRNWVLYLFVLPVIIWYLIFDYWPMYGVQIAFQNYKIGETFGTSEWIGFKFFEQFFNSYWFPVVMKNTVMLSLLSFVLGFPLPIIIALLLNEVVNTKFKKTVQTITYAPHFISTVVLCGALQLFLSPESGIIGVAVNAVREMMGLADTNLLMNGPAFKWIYVLSGIWQGTGWGSVVYFAALSAVDLEQIEAARIDGASKLQRIWYINIPVLIPTIVIQLILQCGGLLSVGYTKVYLLQNDSILSYSEVISTYVYRAGINGAQFSFGTAIGLFNNVINSVLMIVVNQIVRMVDKDMSMF